MNDYSQIRWQRKDYYNLKKAIYHFNKKIKEIEKEEKNLILPDLVKYKDVKSDIISRKQLNQILTSLNRIRFKNAFDKIELASGENITRWEYREINKKQPLAISRIQKNLEEEYLKLPKEFKGLKNDRIQKLESTLRTLQNYQTKEGDSLRYSINRIRKIGQVDYENKKNQVFKENFLYALKEGASKFKNYKNFYNDIKNLKPKQLYEKVKDSTILMDLFIWYDDETGTLQYGSFKNNEDAFNQSLQELGYELVE